MTNEKVVNKLKHDMDESDILTAEEREMLSKIIEALEKQIPKKPKCRLYHSDARCPVCNTLTVFELKYCHECGQALDWSE